MSEATPEVLFVVEPGWPQEANFPDMVPDELANPRGLRANTSSLTLWGSNVPNAGLEVERTDFEGYDLVAVPNVWPRRFGDIVIDNYISPGMYYAMDRAALVGGRLVVMASLPEAPKRTVRQLQSGVDRGHFVVARSGKTFHDCIGTTLDRLRGEN